MAKVRDSATIEAEMIAAQNEKDAYLASHAATIGALEVERESAIESERVAAELERAVDGSEA